MDRRGDRRYPPRFSPAGFERAGVNHTYSLEVIRLFRARKLADDDGDPGPAAPSRCTHDLDLRLPPARSTARSVEDRSERYVRTDVPCGDAPMTPAARAPNHTTLVSRLSAGMSEPESPGMRSGNERSQHEVLEPPRSDADARQQARP